MDCESRISAAKCVNNLFLDRASNHSALYPFARFIGFAAGNAFSIVGCLTASFGRAFLSVFHARFPGQVRHQARIILREAEPGAKGKLAGILKSSVLVKVGGKFVTVSNKMLDRISVCQPRELSIAEGDRLHLKANRKLASGRRVTNNELVTAKSVYAGGEIELSDGRVLDNSFREFLPGYRVTSYGSQGKTVDYVLFSDSTVKAATNAQQWYVTISRGRRGIRIFTPGKALLRENVARFGHRPLALEFAAGFVPRRGVRLWDRLHGYLLRFGRRAADNICRLKLAHRRHHQPSEKHEHKITRMLGERPTGTRITH